MKKEDDGGSERSGKFFLWIFFGFSRVELKNFWLEKVSEGNKRIFKRGFNTFT